MNNLIDKNSEDIGKMFNFKTIWIYFSFKIVHGQVYYISNSKVDLHVIGNLISL